MIPHPDLAVDFAFHLKQRGALLAKGRLLGLQFRALFADGLFQRAARHANDRARAMADGVRAAGHRLSAEPESNQVFAILPDTLIESLSRECALYVWERHDADHSVVRLVTSWSTPAEQVDRFVAALG
ncbi:MAG: hypothetical protein R2710_22890 [Acidimicrobiales bacterium]